MNLTMLRVNILFLLEVILIQLAMSLMDMLKMNHLLRDIQWNMNQKMIIMYHMSLLPKSSSILSQ